ncbi:MAG: ribonucleotide-diphosphate reductase subunit beta [Idiomarinaceae bacterium]|nr:ribonucleotide-diphosphate reductase subunit beta [Idiomarinaceae bacterium]|tara:strand:- start:54851 stop:55927 length:1077 start_codon:yes stop_codon:yes gene_type:complete
MKLKTFPTQTKSHTEKEMFFDDGVDVARYDVVKYPVFSRLSKEQFGFTWGPEEISLAADVVNFRKFDAAKEHIFTANLKRQILLDSIQGRGPLEALLPICSLPELENWFIRWSASEVVHSETYVYMIRALYTNPSYVFDNLRSIPEIEECAASITPYYDNLIHFDGEYGSKAHRKALWMCLNAINALEAVRFYVSFACTYAFGKAGLLTGCADEIRLINQDEDLHRKGTTEMIKHLLKENPIYTEIRDECEEEVTQMFVDVIEQECAWADYLFKEGSMLGLTAPLLKEYVRWVGTKRMRGVGLKSPYKISQHNPLPWVDEYVNEANSQKSPQEEGLTSYEKGRVVQDFDTSNFADFSL